MLANSLFCYVTSRCVTVQGSSFYNTLNLNHRIHAIKADAYEGTSLCLCLHMRLP